jgi:hypothetical protein
VSAARLHAGQEYVDTLDRLGMAIDGAMWAVSANGRVELLLVSRLVDRLGPNVIHRAPFKAYELAKTPRMIDPWDVTVFGLGTRFKKVIDSSPIISAAPVVMTMLGGHKVLGDPAWMPFEGWRVRGDWMIRLPPRNVEIQAQSTQAQLRRWQRFEEHLQAA